MDSRDRVTLITGASLGLGFEVARLLAGRGERLVITARRAGLLQRAAAELSSASDTLALPGDVSDPQHAARLVRAGLERFGRIDALVSNASALGPSPMPALADFPLAALEGVLRTNLLAPLRLAQLVLPAMRRQGGGAIVNVSSDAGVEAYAGWGGYGASKSALDHLSRVMAVELAGTGIRVYAFDPGDMDTELHRLAEPGTDLSHLPGPQVPAPAIVRLIDHSDLPSGRYQAGRLLELAAA